MRTLFITALIAILGGAVCGKDAENNLVFAYHQNRHGAKSPKIQDLPELIEIVEKFPLGQNELTSQGMRQRYLKGRYNRQRLIFEEGLLSEEFTPGEIYIQSDANARTILSAYSEMLGYYPVEAVDAEGDIPQVALPPFRVRDTGATWGKTFPQATIMNFPPGGNNDFRQYSCPAIVLDLETRMMMAESTDGLFREQLEAVRWPLLTALGLDDDTIANTTIYDLFEYSRIFDAASFEGHKMEMTFTEENEHLMSVPNAIKISVMYPESQRKLYLSKIVDRPIRIMDYKVQRILGKVEPIDQLDQLRLFAYDGHSTQTIGMLQWLKPLNLTQPTGTEYATQISFELFSSETCLGGGSPSQDCFSVQVLFNNVPLEFEGCEEPARCTYPEFRAYITSIWSYQDEAGELGHDWAEACAVEVAEEVEI